MYHYVYQLDHIETGEFYIGSRSSKVHPTIDSYLGSMVTWKPDKTKLKKTVLKDGFLNREDAIYFEASEITKVINEKLNRNYKIPLSSFHTAGKFNAKNTNGDIVMISIDDPRYLSGEFVGITKGTINVVDKNGNFYKVMKDDPRYLSGELKFMLNANARTQKHCEALSKSNLGKHIGSKNSQFGTCWITDGLRNKKIKKEDLTIFENANWTKGRTCN